MMLMAADEYIVAAALQAAGGVAFVGCAAATAGVVACETVADLLSYTHLTRQQLKSRVLSFQHK